MSDSEVIVLLASLVLNFYFAFKWYKPIVSNQSLGRNGLLKFVLGILPVISFIIINYTLKELASFDVVNDGVYIFFYILLGFAWIFTGIWWLFYFFDLSWIDDVVNSNNKAAFDTVIGGFLGITFIYAGANIGDGPGWWCVIVAGGIGMILWVVLARCLHRFTGIFEKITVGRDTACGIRIGSYLLASGLIIGRASAGDWTSFSQTILEFWAGWPALVVTILALFVELYYNNKEKDNGNLTNNSFIVAIFWGVLYLVIAVLSLYLYPLPQNPIYESELLGLIGGRL